MRSSTFSSHSESLSYSDSSRESFGRVPGALDALRVVVPTPGTIDDMFMRMEDILGELF